MVTLLYSKLPRTTGAPRLERPFVVCGPPRSLCEDRCLSPAQVRALATTAGASKVFVAWIKRDVALESVL